MPTFRRNLQNIKFSKRLRCVESFVRRALGFRVAVVVEFRVAVIVEQAQASRRRRGFSSPCSEMARRRGAPRENLSVTKQIKQKNRKRKLPNKQSTSRNLCLDGQTRPTRKSGIAAAKLRGRTHPK